MTDDECRVVVRSEAEHFANRKKIRDQCGNKLTTDNKW